MTVIQEMLFMNMPQDPFILFSFVNTQLRDRYASLEEFCSANCCEMQDICDKLSSSAALLAVMQGRDTKPGAEETSKTVLRKFPRKSNDSDLIYQKETDRIKLCIDS